MSTWKEMDARDKVVILVAVVVGAFALLSLIAVFILALRGVETGEVWGRVFDLISVLAGGLIGFIAGQSVEKTRLKKEVPH